MTIEIVKSSGLWRKLASEATLQATVLDIRDAAEAIASRAAYLLPDFTDHSVEHMDALWRVTSVVLTDDEIDTLSVAEAFVLGASFYIHDLGMCVSATPDGRARLEATPEYNASLTRYEHACGMQPDAAGECARMDASRELHGKLAESLANDGLPGLERHLLQSREIRDSWATVIGQVSASHNWSLREVEDKLGRRGSVPAPVSVGGTIDPAYVACVLRIVDYAHINAARARFLDRVLRTRIAPSSLLHWKAQEYISGPERQDHTLAYASTRPIADVEGWWTFFELARGLHVEIESVREYLDSRANSRGRFSLRGVRGASSAKQFAELVQASEFEPVDLRFRPDSMERLIDLLGGRSLYGDDSFAPLRELLQNAVDAVRLRRTVEEGARLEPREGLIEVDVTKTVDQTVVSITDDGVGMSERVISNYLLGIASNYWQSSDFFADHPAATRSEFHPIGRFGIGFLSVFMIGDEVTVTTQSHGGGGTIELKLHGIGRRGALRRRPVRLRSGTTVAVQLRESYAGTYRQLREVVQARAPMLDLPVKVTEAGNESVIEAGWWTKISQEEFTDFLRHQPTRSITAGSRPDRLIRYEMLSGTGRLVSFAPNATLDRWLGDQPEVIAARHRVLAVPRASRVLLCSRGFAVRWVDVQGLTGIVDDPDVALNASRSAALQWDADSFRASLWSSLKPKIAEAIERLRDEVSIPSRHAFLVSVVNAYGPELLRESELPWITILEKPGHSRMISVSELRELLKKNEEVVVTYGSGPWTAVKSARELCPEARSTALVLPVTSAGQPSPREGDSYDDRQELLDADLSEHFVPKREDEPNRLPGAVLLRLTLSVVEEAWGRSAADVERTRWRSKGNELCGHLVR